MKTKMREILEGLTKMETKEQYDRLYGMIERAFQRQEITWKDYTLGFDLLAKIGRFYGFNI